MTTISVSEFKAKCLSLLDQVDKTKKPICVTRFGRPIAAVVSVTPKGRGDIIGSMKGTFEILGDIISPANDEQDWEVLRN